MEDFSNTKGENWAHERMWSDWDRNKTREELQEE